MTAIGVDYGTRMLKAAMAASGTAPAEVFMLAGQHGQSCLPAIGRSDRLGIDPWAHFLGHLVEPGVAAWLRDRLVSSGDVVGGAGGRQSAVEWHASLLGSLRAAIENARPGEAAGTWVIALPDHWVAKAEAGGTDAWALPRAMEAINWLPRAFVSESAAVLVTCSPSPRRPVALMSLGAGPARLTVWSHESGAWKTDPRREMLLEGVSGDSLRRRLGQFVCDEIVRSMRRDPAEHAEEDQQVQNGVEVLLDGLRSDGDAVFQGSLFGKSVVLPVSRATMLDCCRSFRQDITKALATIAPSLGKFDLYCWGELTTLLPLHEWLVEVDGITELEIAPFHAVAEGAARVAAMLEEGAVAFEPTRCIDVASGRVVAAEAGGIPLLDTVPIDLLPLHAGVEAWVVEVDTGRRHPIRQQLRVGRDPRLEVAFSSTQFPEVGRHHFTIFRVGDEFELHDNESRNGTYVNGEARRVPFRLSPGDRILPGPNGPPLVFEVDKS